MRISLKTFFTILTAVIISGLSPADALKAEIYRFRDTKGSRHYFDARSTKAPAEVESLAATVKRHNGFEDLEQELWAAFPPKSGVEKASLTTVTINSPTGKGSGFFISDRGHVLTNRHVLEGDPEQITRAESELEAVSKIMNDRASWLSHEEDRLKQARINLEKIKESAAAVKNREKRRQALALYDDRLDEYRSWKTRIEQQREEHEKQKEDLRYERYLFKNRAAMAGAASHFTVIARDGRELHAYLVRASETHDLALLKIDGYHTPRLDPADIEIPGQGSEVYAIGGPAGLRDSVSRGVISGLEGGFIKTDAGIYPGNSGGPLVTPEGKAVGVNTFKLLTSKFEGLGFAIPIRTALEEFSAGIGQNHKK